jgi:hypothetical protein
MRTVVCIRIHKNFFTFHSSNWRHICCNMRVWPLATVFWWKYETTFIISGSVLLVKFHIGVGRLYLLCNTTFSALIWSHLSPVRVTKVFGQQPLCQQRTPNVLVPDPRRYRKLFSSFHYSHFSGEVLWYSHVSSSIWNVKSYSNELIYLATRV